MIDFPPTITIFRNIFHDINTWLDIHGKSNERVISIDISSRGYILNFYGNGCKTIFIPIEDIKDISNKKNVEFQKRQIESLKL